MRIATLLPSATEIATALGLEPVAVSHEGASITGAESASVVVRPRVDGTGTSAAIDEAVAAADADGGVYDIDADALVDADPDLVVTQGVCDVCAVDTAVVRDTVADLDLDAEILTTDAHRLADVLRDVRRIGDATGTGDEAESVVTTLRSRIDRVEAAAATTERTPRVAVLDWMDPVMVAGHWIPEMVDLAGGTSGITDPGAFSAPTDWETVLEFDPEVLVVAPCGFPVDHTLDHVDELRSREGWDRLSSVRNGRAFAMDGDRFVNRPSHRLVDTLEHLAGLIHPSAFEEPPADVYRPIGARRPA